MLEHLFVDPAAIGRFRSGPLGPLLDSFAASQMDLGYTTSTARVQIRLLSQLSRWLMRKKVPLGQLNEQLAGAFLDHRQRHRCLGKGDWSAVSRFLDHLRREGVIDPAEAAGRGTPRELLLSRYEAHSKTERGLAGVTVHTYVFFIRRFLIAHFGQGPLSLREIRPLDLTRFILRHSRSTSPRGAKAMVTALRSFFRFLLQGREIETDLAASIPAVANWRHSTMPKYLTTEEVERLLGACDRGTSTGRRDHAIILLLARLGLRAGEVVALTLDHIDWRAGEIMVAGKGLVHDRMPLPAEVGEALATYLQRDRPACKTRRLFLRMRAPHRGLADASSVSTLVQRALDRADLHPLVKGAHLLRHSLATGMLQRGASLSEIGELLRHRAPNTTEIYAKVDFEGLRSVAKTWPGCGGGQ
jgi:site-specific recombinase XerD